MTRRQWFGTVAAAAGAQSIRGAAPRTPIGVELYTVRELMKKDPDSTLRAIAEIGYSGVEGDRAQLAAVMPLLAKYKLKTSSVMLETPLATGKWNVWKMKPITWDEAIDSVAKVGGKYGVIAYLMPGLERSAESLAAFPDHMNEGGEKFRKAGLRLCYHNHAFEFGGQPGERTIDKFLKAFDPKLVGLEVDVFWVSVAGNDPVEFLNANKGRVDLVHLKDKKAGAPVQYTEMVKPATFAEVGSGSLDFPAILKASQAAGVQQYHVEQDFTSGDPLASLKKSWEYLQTLAD